MTSRAPRAPPTIDHPPTSVSERPVPPVLRPLAPSPLDRPQGLPTPEPVWLRRRPRNRPLLHAALFLATLVSTTFLGHVHYAGFASDFLAGDLPAVSILSGIWYSATILAILGTHEMGHYLACRYYRVDASLPYFIPAPFIMTGTFGAVIRIRQRVPTKRMLFDIGAAGPIAGFVVVVPALFLGVWLSRVVPMPEDFVGFNLGEPLLFQFAAWLIWGSGQEGYTINLHPMGLAAWFGLLITAINLFPIAQLDGGHISYAALGHHSTAVTIACTIAVVALAVFVSPSWAFWALMMVVMLVAFGARHPSTEDEHIPLDPTRRWIAVMTLIIFVLCFTPAPIEVLDLITPPE